MPAGELVLPTLGSVKLRNFSIYTAQDEVQVTFDKPVLCLVGANGLGKSTFLQATVYALTGLVRNPDYSFKGVEDFDKGNWRFARRYFEGRIRGRDKETADVEVSFWIGDTNVSVRRGFMDRKVLSWSVTPWSAALRDLSADNPDDYERAVARLCGLKSFSQFSFLIHYVVTFDESRQLVFWNSDILTQAVYLLIGWNSDDAAVADTLARRIEGLDSNVRNLQWDMTQARSQIRTLQQAMEDARGATSPSDVEVVERHQKLSEELDLLEQEQQFKRERLSDLLARIAEVSAQHLACRRQYDDVYREVVTANRVDRLRNHPAIVQTLREHQCALCGTTGDDVMAGVQLTLGKDSCPLCLTEIRVQDQELDPKLLEQLRDLDKELMELGQTLDSLQKDRQDVDEELRSMTGQYETARLQVLELETTPAVRAAGSGKSGSDTTPALIKSFLDLIQSKAIQKEEAMAQRDDLKAQAIKLQKRLAKSYQDAEEEFLPLFKDLARRFMGLPVNIQMSLHTKGHKPEVRFTLELGDSDRQYNHQLSESQRFFIDIALRMAFVAYVSRRNEGGFLLVDTPEGSLDIAYETNAGEMLAHYAGLGRQLVLTANLNSSGLIRSLAKECGAVRMELQRMIDWTNLSTVQYDRFTLFEKALDEIETLLR